MVSLEMWERVVLSYVEKVKLVDCAADTVGEEEGVPLQPGHFHCGIFEASSWCAHLEILEDSISLLYIKVLFLTSAISKCGQQVQPTDDDNAERGGHVGHTPRPEVVPCSG